MYDCLSDMHTINYNTADMGDPCVGFCDHELHSILVGLICHETLLLLLVL